LHRSNRTHYNLPNITRISEKQISKLEVDKADNSLVLNKKDNTWYIEPKGYPADSDKVKNMIDAIENLTLTALVSESKNYERYDLTGDKKITVKAWQGKTLSREFDIGKTANTYQHTFVRLAKDSNVYHARGDFRRKFDQTVDNLRDKTVLAYTQNDIREISLNHEKKTTTLSKKQLSEQADKKKDEPDTTSKKPEIKIVWQDAEGKKMDNSKVNRLLSSLNGLKCETYMRDEKKDHLKNPSYTLTLKGDKTYSISIFPKKDKEAKTYPAISSENDYPFLLAQSQMEKIQSMVEGIMEAK
jgi:hypothetical protein